MANFYPRPPRGGRPDADLADLIFLDISIHALREEGDRHESHTKGCRNGFLSTPSARRATLPRMPSRQRFRNFYPRPPRGGRRVRSGLSRSLPRDFYPRPPRGGRPQIVFMTGFCYSISIHALREEGDRSCTGHFRPLLYFYPRPPRGGRPATCARLGCMGKYFYPRPPRGGRRGDGLNDSITSKFLSTPSARRATPSNLIPQILQVHFYPRPPRGGRQYGQQTA